VTSAEFLLLDFHADFDLNSAVTIETCHRCVGDQACENQVVNECLPVPWFGDITSPKLQVVTVGLNPALNEFCQKGTAVGRPKRLAVLADYKADSREHLSDADVSDAESRRKVYFRDVGRDWHSYFEKMDNILYRVNPAWTYVMETAAHIDLVACATRTRWGDLSSRTQDELIKNCREHFIQAIRGLPDGTVILCDGRRAIKEIGNLGFRLVMQAGQLINVRPESGGDHGMLGEFFCDDKKFPVRGWSSQASRLSAVWRFDLACWLRGTLPKDKV